MTPARVPQVPDPLQALQADPLLLPETVAQYRHTTTDALAVERQEGRGPKFVKDGRRVRYRLSDLLAYIETNTVVPHRTGGAA
jgi:hypothetical protein